ncbi:uncharacterized protein LOC113301809 [Papaver somniferum]|uniref:uncharacterized protein LOC113301809 n=1 Tax=Papaver somniferum TaxID=3469 RepID=UPI000E6F6A8C|nr:uncharacterized protein LOC113301809 [Papaver somniferum]
MGSISYLVREKFQLYNHLLDLKRRYQDILNDVPSPSRNYHLSQTGYLINFTKKRWESIYIPPLEEQFVHGVVNTKMVEVKEQSDDLASTMLTKEVFYATMEKYFGKKNCSHEDPEGDSKITSKSSDEEDPTKSIGIDYLIPTSDSEDFSVVTSEEAKSIPTSVQLDSSSQVLNRVESQKVSSISAGAVKDNDGSSDYLNFPFNETAKIDVKDFALMNQIKIGEVNYSSLDFHFNKFEKKFANHEDLKKFNTSYGICVDCCSFLLDITRSLFDREGDRFLFLLLARVVSSSKTNKWYAQVFGMKGAEIFFLQLKCELLAVIKLGVSKCQNSPPCYSYVVKMAMLRSMLTSDHSGVCFYLYFVATHPLFDRGKWYNWSKVMANYNGNCVIALIFKLGYLGKLLRKSSVTLILVTWVETGVVCKLLDKRLQQAVKELFDQLHHSSSYSFGDSLILQLGNGSRNLLYIHVFARQYAGELWILSKRPNYKLVFLSLRASKLCGVSLQRGIELCLLPLCLWCIASVEAFTWIFTWLPEGPKSTVDGSNEYCSGRNAFLVEG